MNIEACNDKGLSKNWLMKEVRGEFVLFIKASKHIFLGMRWGGIDLHHL